MKPLTPIPPSNQSTTQPRDLAQPAPRQVEPQQADPVRLDSVVNQLSKVLSPNNLSVGLNVDKERDSLVIVVTDNATGEMIRTIPSEEALRLSERLEDAASILFNDEA